MVASGLIPMFLLCFLLGYLIYAGLFLSIGALCNDLKEAQNVQGPMMLIMMVPLFTMIFVNRDPHGTIATILTWIPLYTPFTMMNRAAADPPLMELVGATLLMIATAAAPALVGGPHLPHGHAARRQPPEIRRGGAVDSRPRRCMKTHDDQSLKPRSPWTARSSASGSRPRRSRVAGERRTRRRGA